MRVLVLSPVYVSANLPRYIPLKPPYTTRLLAEIFTKEILWLHRNPIFSFLFVISGMSCSSWKGSQMKISIVFHLQKNGQMEVVNWCLETFLHRFIAVQPNMWVLWLPQARIGTIPLFMCPLDLTFWSCLWEGPSYSHLVLVSLSNKCKKSFTTKNLNARLFHTNLR